MWTKQELQNLYTEHSPTPPRVTRIDCILAEEMDKEYQEHLL